MFSPIAVGDASIIHNTFKTDSGIFSLAGISAGSMAMHFVDSGNATLRVGTGTWTITNASGGQADYAPSADDVAVAASYRIYPVITLSTGPKSFDPQLLELRNLP